jgi:hypothetical protein
MMSLFQKQSSTTTTMTTTMTRSNAISRLHTLCYANGWHRPYFEVEEVDRVHDLGSIWYYAQVDVDGVLYYGSNGAASMNAARVEAAVAALRMLDSVVG